MIKFIPMLPNTRVNHQQAALEQKVCVIEPLLVVSFASYALHIHRERRILRCRRFRWHGNIGVAVQRINVFLEGLLTVHGD